MCGCNKNKQLLATTARPPPAPRAPAASRIVSRAQPVRTVQAITPAPVVDLTSYPPNADTSVWGAALWSVLHICAMFTGTGRHISLWKNVTKALRIGIPCDECRGHYQGWHDKNPIKFKIMFGNIHNDAVKWVATLHNQVNARIGKPQWTRDQVKVTYSGNRSAKLAEARGALTSIKEVLGGDLYTALDQLILTLDS